MKTYARADRGIHLNNEEIKNRILTVLKERPLRAGELAKRTNISRMTLTKRLPQLEKQEYLFRDPQTRTYSLAEKGTHELDRLQDLEWFSNRQHEVYLPGQISGGLDLTDILPGVAGRSLGPLPIPVSASLYVSKEFERDYHLTEEMLKYTKNYGDKTARRKLLERTAGGPIEEFFFRHLWERCIKLVKWNVGYKKREIGEPPPPLDLDSVLGFSLGLTFRYDGRKAIETCRKDPMLLESMRCRLVGYLLLDMSFYERVSYNFTYGEMLKHMGKGGLIPKNDAKRILRLIERIHGKRIVGVGKDEDFNPRWNRHPTRGVRKAVKVLLRIALGYLKKGGGLKDHPTLSLDEMVDKVFNSHIILSES